MKNLNSLFPNILFIIFIFFLRSLRCSGEQSSESFLPSYSFASFACSLKTGRQGVQEVQDNTSFPHIPSDSEILELKNIRLALDICRSALQRTPCTPCKLVSSNMQNF